MLSCGSRTSGAAGGSTVVCDRRWPAAGRQRRAPEGRQSRRSLEPGQAAAPAGIVRAVPGTGRLAVCGVHPSSGGAHTGHRPVFRPSIRSFGVTAADREKTPAPGSTTLRIGATAASPDRTHHPHAVDKLPQSSLFQLDRVDRQAARRSLTHGLSTDERAQPRRFSWYVAPRGRQPPALVARRAHVAPQESM